MAPLPMFPLGTVLFPTMILPLHVFEERYRALTRDVLDGDGRFGVVLISRGHEVGGGDERCGVGTVASVLEGQEVDDGRWMLVTIGSRRFRVTRWLPDDPYPRAEVEGLDEHDLETEQARALRDRIERTLRTVAALRHELDQPAPPLTTELHEDPVIAGWQAASLAGLQPFDAQAVLEEDDPAARLETLARLLDDQAGLLRSLLESA